MKEFENEKSIKIQKLERFDRNTYSALIWINQNQHKLEKPVYGPICIDISVKDSRYTDFIESSINGSTMKVFYYYICNLDFCMLL